VNQEPNAGVPHPRRRRKKKRALKGMGSVFERNGIQWIAFTYRGVRHRESTEQRLEGVAVDILKERISQIKGGTFAPGGRKVTLATLRDLVYADMERNGRTSVVRAKEHFANIERHIPEWTPAEEIPYLRDRYITARLAEQVRRPKRGKKPAPPPDKDARRTSNATVNRELGTLRHAFRLGRKATPPLVMTTFEFDKLAEPPPRRDFLEGKDLESVIGNLPDYLRDPIRVCAATGWRVRSVLDLPWSSVRDDGTIVLQPEQVKTRKVVVFHYAENPKLRRIIEGRRVATRAIAREHGIITPLVFWRLGGPKGQPAALPLTDYRKAWGDARTDAGLPWARVHGLRRAFARAATNAGIDRKTAMELAGWSTESTFSRYNIRDERDARAAVRKLAGLPPVAPTRATARQRAKMKRSA